SRALFPQQRMQGRLAVAIAERTEQPIYRQQPLIRRFGDCGGPSRSVCWMMPAPEIAIGWAINPVNAREPVARTGQWTDGIPAQGRQLGSRPRLDLAATRLRYHALKHGDEVFAQPQRVPDEIGALATAVERIELTEQRPVRSCARASSSRRVQTQPQAAWLFDDLNRVAVRGCATRNHWIDGCTVDPPVRARRKRKNQALDALRPHATGP